MERAETLLKEWLFSLGEKEEAPKEGYQRVTIPHDWVNGRTVTEVKDYTFREASQGFFDRYDVGWYQCDLNLKDISGEESIYLCFGGIFENSTVWVNGHEVGGHHFGYTSFELDITGVVHEGSNTLLVRVDNTAEPADRWYSGCGIYRPVKLVRLPKQHIERRKVATSTKLTGKDAVLTIATGTDHLVEARLVLPDGRIMVGTGKQNITLSIADAPLWSAEDPKLCNLTLSLLEEGKRVDSCTMRIGLREAAFKTDGLYLNGHREILRGVCIHQDFAPVGIAVTPELWRERLKLLKEMGCNAIRAAHHVYAEEFLNLCDEMGFYVYEECFDKWHSGLYGRYFDTDWSLDIEAMVTRDRNRACVLLWGVGNEVENQALPSMLETLEMLVKRVKTMDTTRPVTYAMNPHFKRPAKIDLSQVKDVQAFVDEVDEREIEDMDERIACISKIAKLVDVISCNYQEQWYEEIHTANPNKPILGTEIFQYFMGHRDNMQNYVEHLPSLVPEKCEYVVGGFIWTGFDYLGESMGWPSKGWTGSIFRTNNTKRFSYYILKAIWSKEPVMRVGILDYTLPDEFCKEHWSVPSYEEMWDYPQIGRTVLPIMAATNCDKVVIDYGPKVLILDENSRDANGMLRGFIPYVEGRLVATGYKDGAAVCTQTICTPKKAFKLVFESASMPAKGEKVLLTVQIQDEDGQLVHRDTRDVHFHVAGTGCHIVGTDNGDLICHTPYSSTAMPLYRGRVSVLIERDTEEPFTVYAEAEGLEKGAYSSER